MIKFVNAKINLGLNVVRKREDGYHDLETVFFPVGLESGLPQQPEPFDDILEVTVRKDLPTGCKFRFMGRKVECEAKDNLVVKATQLYFDNYFKDFGINDRLGQIEVSLDKHLPDGAGMGGGSADASFTLIAINEMLGNPYTQEEIAGMARKLGADCPFFVYNTPSFAEGIGEKLQPLELLYLKGCFLLIVKPPVHVSTRDAFAGIHPHKPEYDLRFLPSLPLSEWRDHVVNNFEDTVFPKFPLLASIKRHIYETGAVYASMTGSGASLYGIFENESNARECYREYIQTYDDVWLFRI